MEKNNTKNQRKGADVCCPTCACNASLQSPCARLTLASLHTQPAGSCTERGGHGLALVALVLACGPRSLRTRLRGSPRPWRTYQIIVCPAVPHTATPSRSRAQCRPVRTWLLRNALHAACMHLFFAHATCRCTCCLSAPAFVGHAGHPNGPPARIHVDVCRDPSLRLVLSLLYISIYDIVHRWRRACDARALAMHME